MEFIVSIIAVFVSGLTFLFTVMITYRGEQREKRQCWGGQHKVGGDFGSVVFYGKIREFGKCYSRRCY